MDILGLFQKDAAGPLPEGVEQEFREYKPTWSPDQLLQIVGTPDFTNLFQMKLQNLRNELKDYIKGQMQVTSEIEPYLDEIINKVTNLDTV